MIDFNRPAFTGKEFEYIRDAVERGMLCGDGIYTKKCSAWMEKTFSCRACNADDFLYPCAGDGCISCGYPAR